MLIIAHHNVHDLEGFWDGAKRVLSNLPPQFKVLGMYPAADGKTGTCLWEADSVQEVQAFLDKEAGPFAKNFCYELDVTKAIGLNYLQQPEAQLA